METKETTDCRFFTAGDVVLCCEPLVWVLDSSAYETRCAYCLQKSQELRTCSGCKLHRYCSVACQSADWKLEHKLECVLLKTATGRDIIAKLANKIKLNVMMDIPGMGRKSAKDLLSMLPVNPAQSEINRTVTPSHGMEELKAIGVPVTELLVYYGLVRYNGVPMHDALCHVTAPFGMALYPQAPLPRMTPVCWDVNVVLNFQGRRLLIHAVEDIPQYTGLEDLRYNDALDPFSQTREERRADFEKRYGYPCACRRCTPEYDAEINPLRCVTPGCMNPIPSDSRAHQPCSECGAINSARLAQFSQFIRQLHPNYSNI
ncbi:histone-lysine N-methyltransferase SMYD3-like [Paramacrobiotus metropolitanus]|uniref:histone-lysine N-methyltransferase SMYD3-like n=1 Tax=Paramacrobiotus metropolitanus TaxID=2943436 RepID=UPI0024461E0F|nr:histone-lysine N-methyltransferase SMYD3-like [Paramacrobiotus metropolitanus]